MDSIIAKVGWVFALFTSFVFSKSLFYKVDGTSLETQHIFTSIGNWMRETPLGDKAGDLFMEYGQYIVGGAELVTVLLLLLPVLFIMNDGVYHFRRMLFHSIGALFALIIMAVAIFFHNYTLLSWDRIWSVENASQCSYAFNEVASTCTDASLANMAIIIFIFAALVLILNRKYWNI